MADKSAAQSLKDKLFLKNDGIKGINDVHLKASEQFAKGYKVFLDNAKTEREAVAFIIDLAKQNGYSEFKAGKQYKSGDKYYINNRSKAVALVMVGKESAKNGINISAAHIDSPRLDLKPNPLYEEADMALLKTHYYGGIKKYQWTAIPLALHGVFALKNGEVINVCIGEDENEPCFVVNDLLPHLATEQNKRTLNEGIKGEELNILVGSYPFKDCEESESVKLNILNILFEKYGVTEADFLSAELMAVPAFKARDIGFDGSLVGAYGHDDRVCAYAELIALMDTKNPTKTCVAVFADKEEVGSNGNTGLASDFIKHIVRDIADYSDTNVFEVLKNSRCLSADVNAAFDPTFSDVNERRNASYINKGVVITKYTGSRGKSGTSDASAEYVASIRNMLDNANIIWQTGELGKVDAGGGGTVAMFIANLGVDVVDLGVPVLSMHAPFETISKFDLYEAYRAFLEFNK
ncbi:MAG: aminopeptidase [Clostridia bacterium]|nr:aminopeptidase [Clostridia bacterium]